MTLTDTATPQTLTAEQVCEIQTMAEGGQFADALIRLRKVKAFYPHTTFFVALEKQLERLLVLPRDTEQSDAQKKELLESLPGLVHGAVQAMRSGPPTRPTPAPPPPKPSTERSDRELARIQLKEQYFQHADEYLKKGAYGSALVEIRRVKIIAPDDQTALEYERTIRQLVELQQRSGVRTEDIEGMADGPARSQAPPRTVRTFGDEPAERTAPEPPPLATIHEGESATRRRGKRGLFGLLALALLGGGGAAAVLLPPADGVEQQQVAEPSSSDKESAPTAAAADQSNSEQEVIQERFEPVTPAQPPATKVQESVDASGDQRLNTALATRLANAQQERDQKPVMGNREEAASAEQAAIARDPQIVRLVEPVFPPEVLAIPGGGEVVVMVQVDATGKPVKTLIAKSTNPAFNQPIITAVLRSTFEAGRSATGPETKWMTIPFRVN